MRPLRVVEALVEADCSGSRVQPAGHDHRNLEGLATRNGRGEDADAEGEHATGAEIRRQPVEGALASRLLLIHVRVDAELVRLHVQAETTLGVLVKLEELFDGARAAGAGVFEPIGLRVHPGRGVDEEKRRRVLLADEEPQLGRVAVGLGDMHRADR
jgi:hypothetical protein